MSDIEALQGDQQGTNATADATSLETGDSQAAREPGSAPQSDGGDDFKSRFMQDPSYAWEQYQGLRSKNSESVQKARLADPLLQLAQWAGNGDPAAGVQALDQAVRQYANVLSNPQMKKLLDYYNQNGRVPDSYLDLDEPAQGDADPMSQRFDELSQRNQRLESRIVQREVRDTMADYFQNDELGRVMNPQEKQQVLQEIFTTIQRAAANPAQRSVLENLNADTLAQVAMAWARREGKLAEFGERIAQGRAQNRQRAATESPSGLGSTAAVKTTPDYGSDHLRAIQDFARELGVDLSKPQVR